MACPLRHRDFFMISGRPVFSLARFWKESRTKFQERRYQCWGAQFSFWLSRIKSVCLNFQEQLSAFFEFLDRNKNCSTVIDPVQICYDLLDQNCYVSNDRDSLNFFVQLADFPNRVSIPWKNSIARKVNFVKKKRFSAKFSIDACFHRFCFIIWPICSLLS